MNKKPDKSKYEKLTVSIPPKLDKAIRDQAHKEGLTLGDLVERYREAYLREKERERKEKEAKKTTEKSE